MEFLMDPSIWVGLLTLVVLEIVLGIDNLVFIAILADKLLCSPTMCAYDNSNGHLLPPFIIIGTPARQSYRESYNRIDSDKG